MAHRCYPWRHVVSFRNLNESSDLASASPEAYWFTTCRLPRKPLLEDAESDDPSTGKPWRDFRKAASVEPEILTMLKRC